VQTGLRAVMVTVAMTQSFEDVSAALSSVWYQDFVAKGEVSGVMITGGSGLFII
jgi:Flp pilus assembly pilin Flp